MKLQANGGVLLPDGLAPFLQLLFSVVDYDAIIHKTQIFVRPQAFFYVMVDGVRDGNPGQLDHLASWVVSGFA